MCVLFTLNVWFRWLSYISFSSFIFWFPFSSAPCSSLYVLFWNRLFHCCEVQQRFLLQSITVLWFCSSWSLAIQAHKAEEQQKASIWPGAEGWCPKIGILAWEHICSPAMGNAARRAAISWLAKANLPVEGSYKGWSRGGVGSRISISTCTICCGSLQGEGVRESID